MSYFTDKTVWITGASAGIGLAIAKACAAKGAKLILSSRKKESLEKAALECQGASSIDILPLDLENHIGLDTIVKNNKDLISQVDILINNGGISQRSDATDTDFMVYKKLMDVNYLGTVRLSLAVLPYFKKRNSGHFVAMSSVAGKFGVPGRTGYSASKMALHGFFDALRAEMTGTDIHVSMICPGYIKTDISKNALTANGSAQGTMDEAQRNGMAVEVLADKVLQAISTHKAEVHIGGFRETRMAVLVSRLFPALFRKIIAKSRVT